MSRRWKSYRAGWVIAVVSLSTALGLGPVRLESGLAQDGSAEGELSSVEGAWEYWRRDDQTVARRVLELVPRAEHKPALSIQLIPDDFHQKEGNAAVYYLQAMGFFEQTYAQQKKVEFERRNQQEAIAAGKATDEVPPHSWRSTRPEDLPLEQVKEYLQFTSFQPRYLVEAVQRKRCDFERYVRDVENPIGYLLPEIQAMRELARGQSLRFLVAIAEDRTDEAVAILGQQLAIAQHLSQEPFLVSNLVGIACASIGWYDAFYLCEHQSAPNLYWAVAALPTPLVDLQTSLAFEREFLFEQFKVLREVDTTPRSELYWRRFVEQFSEAAKDFVDSDLPFELDPTGLALAIATGFPGAKRYLHEVEGMTPEQLETLPKTQVFFLGLRRYHERIRDEMFKMTYVNQSERAAMNQEFDRELQKSASNYGVISSLSGLILPSVNAAMSAQTRLEQALAFLQTIEAIRHHLATHHGEFPQTLDQLELPAVTDPATGQAFDYVVHSQGATLSGGKFPGFSYEFELRVAQ